MGARHDLQRSIKIVYKHNKEGSFATQADRENMLTRFASDLIGLGYVLRDIRGLKPKHITGVVKLWQEQDLAVATIKNRLAAIRNLCDKINKPNIILKNDELEIGRRQYKPTYNRAIFSPDFSGINNPHIKISLELQHVFGLRREESLKLKPYLADRGDRLELMPSWCKGGRGRMVPIRTEEQRYWLNKAKELLGSAHHQSLIPKGKTYIRHRWVYNNEVKRIGLRNLHGLRHAYAQQRYKELTGWDAPINGGPKSPELKLDQKKIDKQARMVLAEELGHSREQITVSYIGR